MAFNLSGPFRQLALKKFGGLYTETPDQDLPEGVSPRVHDVDFQVQSIKIRPGLKNIIQFGNASNVKYAGLGSQAGTGEAWINPTNIEGPPDTHYASLTLTPLDIGNFLIGSAYGFAITNGRQISGIGVEIAGYQTGGGNNRQTFINVSISSNGMPIGAAKISALVPSYGTVTFGGPTDGWSANVVSAIAEQTSFGIQIQGINTSPATASFYIDSVKITLYLTASDAPGYNWIKTYDAPGQGPLTLAVDTVGDLWQENVDTSPGVMNSIYTNLTAEAKVLAVNAANRIYMTFSDLINALDQPRQYDGTYLDRISQIGPGIGPEVSVTNSSFAINPSPTGLYQPNTPFTIQNAYWTSQPGIQAPGNLLIFENSSAAFIAGVNIGDTIYVSGVSNISGQNPNGVYTVTGTGQYTPTGNYYITVTAPSIQNSYVAPAGVSAQYQKTVAIVSLATPVPNGLAQVGGNLTIAGAGASAWDGTYTITGTPNAGQLSITSDSWLAGIATYSYSPISGNAPGWQAGIAYQVGTIIADPNTPGTIWTVTTAGTSGGTIPSFASSPQTDGATLVWTSSPGNISVTVFDTANGNGAFNVTGATILTANQTTFTVSIAATSLAGGPESGFAFSGSGTLFEIDPGLQYIGTNTDPIFSASGGGTVSFVGEAQAGQRYAISMFLTRNGYMTPASPPVPFYTASDNSGFVFSNLVIGPPNVIARIIAITPANAGIGGPYYWIPEDVTIPDLATGVSKTYNKTIVNDNISSQTGFINFSDTVLLAGENVTQQGNNVLQKRELGACAGLVEYAGRMSYWGEQQKVDNLLNATIDGGYLASTPNIPAGWSVGTALAAIMQINVSSLFGNELYIQNTTGSTFNPTGSVPSVLSQPAYQDAFNAPIILPNTQYSARITCRIPSGNTNGSLIVALVSPSQGSWLGTIAFSRMSQDHLILTTDINNPMWETVPQDLQLQVYPLNMANGADLKIDRMEIYPTLYPVYQTQLAVSYVEDYESIDGVTGILDCSINNNQPIRTAFVLFDTLYIQKTGSGDKTVDNGTTEPAGWDIPTVTNSVGALGSLSVDTVTQSENGTGEDYSIIVSRQGIYVFAGGNHVKISQEIQSIWNLLYQPSLQTIWIKNDPTNKKIYVGVPLPTPNQWLPNAAANASPDSPNVILQMSYLGLETPEELEGAPPAHVSMFSGHMLARDLVRKWNIWQIPTQYMDFIQRSDGSLQLWAGGISGTGKIYQITSDALDDDGQIINQVYCTYGFSDPELNTLLQIGEVRKVFGYMTARVEGAGNLNITAYPENLSTPYPEILVPMPLTAVPIDDMNIPINSNGNYCFFELSVNALDNYFELKRIVVGVQPNPSIPVSGS